MVSDSQREREPNWHEPPSQPGSNDASSFDQQVYQATYWQRAPASGADPVVRATQYLGLLRDLSVEPRWIALAHVADPPGEALSWIGQHIHRVNQQLNAILSDLLECFETVSSPDMQIFAAPIAPQAGVDGFCCDGLSPVESDFPNGTPHERSAPITLIVDAGRIVPADWPGLVAHELAHAIARIPGHGVEFGRAIAHLCLAQDLPMPSPQLDSEALRYWPPCRHNPQPELFWLGRSAF